MSVVGISNLNTLPSADGCDISSITEMYGDDHSSVTQLFPEENQGCINFGLWPLPENLQKPISLNARLISQKNLYRHLFEAAKLSSKDAVVEIGCGRGHGVSWGSERSLKYVGVDLLPKQIQKAQKLYPLLKNNLYVGSADNTGLPTEAFDKVVSLEAAQHFPDFPAFIKESNRLLKDNGCLALSTFFYLGDIGEANCRLVMPSNELALDNTIQLQDATKALKENGFEIDQIESIGRNVFHGFCSWAKQVKVSTPHTVRWVDLYKDGNMDYCIIIAHKTTSISSASSTVASPTSSTFSSPRSLLQPPSPISI